MRRVCPCGCGGRVTPGRTYAGRGCNLRAMSSATRQRFGKEGGYARAFVFRRNLIEALVGLDREAAIVEAYRRGRRAAYHTRDWQRLRARRRVA